LEVGACDVRNIATRCTTLFEGVDVGGGRRLRGIITAFKGDWKFKAEALHLKRWYNTRPRCISFVFGQIPELMNISAKSAYPTSIAGSYAISALHSRKPMGSSDSKVLWMGCGGGQLIQLKRGLVFLQSPTSLALRCLGAKVPLKTQPLALRASTS
jgi:hypothetical protein